MRITTWNCPRPDKVAFRSPNLYRMDARRCIEGNEIPIPA
jgi:hypothetical protein